jgi:Phosphotyrosine interaction domain (PTB/PID)
LAIALREFKRDKINKQNARLSLANAADENPSMPRRKILLSTGANNYRPPLERSKSAPKLFSIEEIVDEEDDEELSEEMKRIRIDERKKRDEAKACCKDDYLYPSVTLGRRRCRRGHSIRKSRLLRGTILTTKNSSFSSNKTEFPISTSDKFEVIKEPILSHEIETNINVPETIQNTPLKGLGSDEDFESFLLCNNYDSKDLLASDLLSYFDMKLQKPCPTLLATTATASLSDLLDDDISLQSQRTCMSMSDLINYQSDNELEDNQGDIYFNQDSLLDTLRRQSKITEITNDENQSIDHESKKPTNEFKILANSRDFTMKPTHLYKRTPLEFEDELTSDTPSSMCMSEKTICVNLDSDEGSSISSGCETSSTVTTNAEENQLPRRGSVLDRVRTFEKIAESQSLVNKEVIVGERTASEKFYLKSSGVVLLTNDNFSKVTRSGTLTKADNPIRNIKIEDDSDELSDESGYVEFQDHSLRSTFA